MRDDEKRPSEDAPEAGSGDADAANVRSDVHNTQTQPETPATMQRDHEDAVGRQRYADARPGDYSPDFQADESGSHPVKPVDEDALDESGIPEITRTEPPKGRHSDDGEG